MESNEMEGLVNYMGGQYLSMMGPEAQQKAIELVGYKGVANPFDKGTRLAQIANMAGGRVWTLTVVNAQLTAQKFYLCPSMLIGESENGHPLSGKSIEGNDLTFTSPNGETSALALKCFYRYIDENPNLILGLRIETSDKTQMSQSLAISTEINPFLVNYPTKTLNIQSYVDENNQQRDIATIDQLLPADRESRIVVPVVPGTHTFTLFMGPALNVTQALRKQAALQSA